MVCDLAIRFDYLLAEYIAKQSKFLKSLVLI